MMIFHGNDHAKTAAVPMNERLREFEEDICGCAAKAHIAFQMLLHGLDDWLTQVRYGPSFDGNCKYPITSVYLESRAIIRSQNVAIKIASLYASPTILVYHLVIWNLGYTGNYLCIAMRTLQRQNWRIQILLESS